MELSEKTVLDALAGLQTPSHEPLVKSTLLAGIDLRQGQVTIVLASAKAGVEELAPLQKEIEQRLKKLAGVSRVLITFTAERDLAPQRLLPHVKYVIAIASGKGGVGKSTTAANLALAFSAQGYRVGLLDADIYGPSVPHLFGLHEPPQQNDDGKIIPAAAHGIKLISIGLMVAQDAPLAWRGPMIDKALTQFLRDVDWGVLDLLLIDMPPGTGDAQLTLTRRAPIDGAIIISTPQDLSLIDAQKGIALFRQVGAPILGIVENMSAFICPHCGKQHDIFAHGGAREEAKRQNVPFLGEIPLHIAIRETSDSGTPLVAGNPSSGEAQLYFKIADAIMVQLNSRTANAAVNEA